MVTRRAHRTESRRPTISLVDTFWTRVGTCLDELETATTADAVIDGLNRHFAAERTESGDGAAAAFFPGSGGDRQLIESLRTAGWAAVWSEASYFYAVRNGAGEILTYVEGDVYRGDRR